MTVLYGLDPVYLSIGFFVFLILWKLTQDNEKADKVNKMPGPMAYPLVGNVTEMMEPREEALRNILMRQEKFGSFFRMWIGSRPAVVFAKPEYIELLLKGTKYTKKGFFYSYLYPWLGTGLLTSHGPKWAMHRKLITPTFHFKVLQGFLDVFLENSKLFADKLKEKAETGEEFDVYPFVTMCTLDIICETAMGTKVNAQLKSENPYVYSVYRLSAIIIQRMTRLWLHPQLIFNLSPTGREFNRHLNTVQNFTDRVIKSRKAALLEKKNSEDFDPETMKSYSFLDLLLESSMEEGSSLLTDEELREEVETFMFEGHDTTASAITWALSLLGCHPKIQDECYEELKGIFQNDPDRTPTLADFTEMKLLERVIKETLRLYPSVVSIGRTIEEDLPCGEYIVPEGTEAIISIYSMHRNPEYYPDPEKFDPDRFLPENSLNRHPYSYIPFSAGPRNCIGQKFAMLEEKVVLSTLLRRYRFEALQPTEETVQIPDLVVRPGRGLRVKISRR